MTKAIRDTENFDRIMQGLGEVLEIEAGRAEPARVFAPADVDVKAIRAAMGMSQTAFAMRFGFSAGTIRDWEQGRRRPDPSARILLKVIEKNPAAVLAALDAA